MNPSYTHFFLIRLAKNRFFGVPQNFSNYFRRVMRRKRLKITALDSPQVCVRALLDAGAGKLNKVA